MDIIIPNFQLLNVSSQLSVVCNIVIYARKNLSIHVLTNSHHQRDGLIVHDLIKSITTEYDKHLTLSKRLFRFQKENAFVMTHDGGNTLMIY